MDGDASRRDVLLAIALGSRRRKRERRLLPERRSEVDRRQRSITVAVERRSGEDRRQNIRRGGDSKRAATLLQKARSRVAARGSALHEQTRFRSEWTHRNPDSASLRRDLFVAAVATVFASSGRQTSVRCARPGTGGLQSADRPTSAARLAGRRRDQQTEPAMRVAEAA